MQQYKKYLHIFLYIKVLDHDSKIEPNQTIFKSLFLKRAYFVSACMARFWSTEKKKTKNVEHALFFAS